MAAAVEIYPGPALLIGLGASARAGEGLPPGPVLLITDQTVRRLGLIDPLVLALDELGHAVSVFDQVEADPAVETVMSAAREGEAAHAKSVIGFGGGSPMDVAKVVAYLNGTREAIDDIWGIDRATGIGLPLVLVPTTAGTGSEATPVAILTSGAEKKAVVSRSLVPTRAILDAGLTVGLPMNVTAATAIDAMVHAIEAYTSRERKNAISDMLALRALMLLSRGFRSVLERADDIEARGDLLLGAHLAGLAFANAPVGGVHALAYPLGARFKVPHGLANSLLLSAVIAHNHSHASDHYGELAVAFGTEGRPLMTEIAGLAQRAGLPSRLREVGIEEASLPMLADDAMLQTRLLRNNPCPIDRAAALRIYTSIF